ncbi:hypothetical protein ACM0P6_05715 [Komagataeibacter sucrofermentans]|nr:hypothetical protein [Komagataeibacter sucrofermentans]
MGVTLTGDKPAHHAHGVTGGRMARRSGLDRARYGGISQYF